MNVPLQSIYRRSMLHLRYMSLVLLLAANSHAQTAGQEIVDRYINSWKDFYPSAAFAYGDVGSAAKFETYSASAVTQWLANNEAMASAIREQLGSSALDSSERVDLRVLLSQTESELANWREDQPSTHQPQWYAEQISQALTHLLVRDQLSGESRSEALLARLAGVQRLSDRGVQVIVGGSSLRTQTALRTLAATKNFYEGNLRVLTADWPAAPGQPTLDDAIGQSAAAVGRLELHLRQHILPGASASAAMNAQHYAAKLARRTSRLYTPEALLRASGKEMRDVRALMIAQAKRWEISQPVPRGVSSTPEQILNSAIAAMESDRQDDSAKFLESFKKLTFAAQRFVEVENIASVPKPTTLIIALSPSHFSGAAVGGVYPTGPFAPESDTLFYVPCVPDSTEPAIQENFYRSFNTHFNTMIMSHEMFPGHYLQYKVAVSQAPAVRSLFANGSYVEGWGSFSEELMLDAGWADDAPLTRLAHLRKRLENATRAYVSVQVNTAGWGESEVLSFARDEGLLAPQFAQNLWQRVVNTPMQITDYFTGYQHFRQLFTDYRALPENAGTRAWVDSVLQAGPVPPNMLSPLL